MEKEVTLCQFKLAWQNDLVLYFIAISPPLLRNRLPIHNQRRYPKGADISPTVFGIAVIKQLGH